MTKRANRIIVWLFCLFIGGFFLLNLFLPDKDFSEKENRSLQTLPKFSFSSLFGGTYATRFESYCSDQFALRDNWIELKAKIELLQGKSQNNGVFLCENNRLIEPYEAPTSEQTAKASEAFNTLADADVPVTLAIIPTSSELYAGLLPIGVKNDSQSAVIQSVYDSSELQTVDLLSRLSEHSDEDIYYRTDHHWTSLGAWYAANALRRAWGLSGISSDALTPRTISEEFCGTLYSSSGFFWVTPDTMQTLINVADNSCVHRYETNGTEETLPVYNYEKLEIKDKYSFFLGGNIPLAIVDTGTEDTPSLLILRDSYSDSLVPFLMDSFSEIHLLDLRYYTGSVKDYIEEQGVDRVLILYGVDRKSVV